MVVLPLRCGQFDRLLAPLSSYAQQPGLHPSPFSALLLTAQFRMIVISKMVKEYLNL